MKTLKNNLKLVATMILTFVVMLSSVSAAPSTLTASGSSSYGSFVAGTHWTYKTASDGTQLYCLDHYKQVPSNTKYKFAGYLDAGYAYIIANGYPNKKFTGNKKYDHYITQGAMHWYIDRINGVSDSKKGQMTAAFKTNGSDPHKLRPYMKKLVEGALAARKTPYVTPTGSISTSSKVMTLASNRTYFISSPITVKTTGTIKSLKVSVASGPQGTVLVDGNGNVKSSFKNGDTFYVKVPTSTLNALSANVKITMSGTGTIARAAKYVPVSNAAAQSLVYSKLVVTDNNFGNSLDFTLTSGRAEISKTDITTGAELPGAKLTIKNSNGGVVDSWISTNQKHVVKNLPEGKYTLTEEIAPDGYVRASNITFTVKNNQVTPVKMVDDYTKIDISKRDIATGAELPGAKLKIIDANGKVVAEWVSTDKPKRIEKLKVGDYTLVEETAPDGYVRAEAVKFTVKETGEITTVVMIDDFTKIDISKQDVTNKKELPGAKLKIYDEAGNLIAEWTSSDKPKRIEKLKVGKYKLVEEVAPEGYVLSKEAVQFEIKETGEVQSALMYNTPLTPAPDTGFHPGLFTYIIATLLGCFGISMVYWNAKKEQ